jgi:hypothetical protein
MNSGNRELDHFQVSQPYFPPPHAEAITASAPLQEQVSKGVRITLE